MAQKPTTKVKTALQRTVDSLASLTISEAESAVMEVLWSRHPQAAEEIAAELSSERDWQGSTVKTLINRLLKKGAIDAEQDGRRYLYRPILKREVWLRSQSTSLLDRLFGGKVAPLVAHFSEHRKLSRDDIAELRRIVSQLEKKQ